MVHTFRRQLAALHFAVKFSSPLAESRASQLVAIEADSGLARPAAVIGHSPRKLHGTSRMRIAHVNVCHKLYPLSSAAAAVLKLLTTTIAQLAV